MSWTTLTPDDLNDYLAAAQLRALRTKALGSGQTDPLPTLTTQVCGHLRSVIASAGYPLEAAAGTLPALLKPAAAALVLELAQTRLPGLALTTEQKTQVANAKSLLRDISGRKVALEAPAVPDSTLSSALPSAVVRVVSGRKNKLSSGDLKRLS